MESSNPYVYLLRSLYRTNSTVGPESMICVIQRRTMSRFIDLISLRKRTIVHWLFCIPGWMEDDGLANHGTLLKAACVIRHLLLYTESFDVRSPQTPRYATALCNLKSLPTAADSPELHQNFPLPHAHRHYYSLRPP